MASLAEGGADADADSASEGEAAAGPAAQPGVPSGPAEVVPEALALAATPGPLLSNPDPAWLTPDMRLRICNSA
jgi:hypothetical protein